MSESVTNKFRMKVSLATIEHLGINLYSNTPAVLSEAVANAWDADATHVSIQINTTKDQIIFEDNGVGMTEEEINEKFLTVGYRKREESTKTEKGRSPMGRKGIGKLSFFAIANVVEVHTVKDGCKLAFLMKMKEIKNKSKEGNNEYHPKEITCELEAESGTKIILRELNKKRTQATLDSLRKKLSRKFSIKESDPPFEIFLNEEKVRTGDRWYYNKIQFLWVYGNNEVAKSLSNEIRNKGGKVIKHELRNSLGGLSIEGWIGTVHKPEDLNDSGVKNLNNIAIYVRGKMAQEDILSTYKDQNIYKNYVVGELHVDDLDQDDKEDVAVSSRQGIIEDDQFFTDFRDWLEGELVYIRGKWRDWRSNEGSKEAISLVPELEDWLDGLGGDKKKSAKKWIGGLSTTRSSDDKTKKELIKGAVLCFEHAHNQDALSALEKIDASNMEEIFRLFGEIDNLEESYYGQIVKMRIEVIRTMDEKVKEGEKEKVIQKHLYDHLWLLDTSWERARGTEAIESRVDTYLKSQGFKDEAEKNNELDRIDIIYRTESSKHIIIELKRPSVTIQVDDLTKQVRKYRDGIKQELSKFAKYKDWPVEIICLLGKQPQNWAENREDIEKTLKTVDARILFYDDLLLNAQKAYEDYFEKYKQHDKLWKIFEAIDAQNFEDSL